MAKTNLIAFMAIVILGFASFGQAAFSNGSRVQTTATLAVRATHSTSGTLLTTEAQGSRGTIASSSYSDGTYTWWYINWNNGYSGWSVDAYLEPVPTLTVSSPNGGESWTAGSTHTVTWTASGDTSAMSYQLVAYSTDGGSTYTTVSSSLTPSTRSYSWTLPSGVSSSQAKVRVRTMDASMYIMAEDTSDGNFTISTVTTYSISISASPSAGGTVSGGGSYSSGSSATLYATANSGYAFSSWTENGSVVSTSASYTFTVTGNRTLVANFTVNTVNYTISLSASPTAGGTASGGGTYASGSSRTVTATANSGYTFANWTENGSVVSSSASYTFTLNGDRNLVANFTTSGQIADNWQFPLAGDWYCRPGFAFGKWVASWNGYHLGEDVWRNGGPADAAYACANGTVRFAGYTSDPFPLVIIEHQLPNGSFVCSVYYHIKFSVSVGQQVTIGSPIGYVSPDDVDSGGPTHHLHFGIRSGAYDTATDSDGKWHYKGYAPPDHTDIVGLWYSPSYFIGKSLIIDEDTPASFFSKQGSSWTAYSSSSVGWSQHLWWTYASDGAAADCWARWNLNGFRDYTEGRFLAGQYEVSVFVPNNYATSVQTKYEIHHAQTVSYATIDQNAYANAWVSLGTYDFASSGDQYVRLNDNTGEPSSLKRMIACDAVRLTYVGGATAGSVQVTLSPAGAVSAGAMWQVDGGTWQSNGATVSGLTVGNHPLAFSTVSGYTTPSGFTVQIVSGTTTSALGLYTLIPQYTITVSASPSAGGTVSGGGTFASGSSWTVTATANSGYTFANWTENSSVVSSSASYNFTLSGNRTLVANFTVNPVSHSPMTVDLNNDGIPNFYDFSIFAKFWQNASCSEPNWCNGSDFNHDGVVDFKDLQIFSEFWLWPVADVDMDSKVNFADYVLFSKRWKQTGCKYPDWCNGCDFDKNGQIDILDLMIFAEWWLEGTRFQLWSVADLDMNGKVNFVDYTLFSSHWKQTACESPDWCYGCDFDKSGTVDILDFAIFADHWLEGTSP